MLVKQIDIAYNHGGKGTIMNTQMADTNKYIF